MKQTGSVSLYAENEVNETSQWQHYGKDLPSDHFYYFFLSGGFSLSKQWTKEKNKTRRFVYCSENIKIN